MSLFDSFPRGILSAFGVGDPPGYLMAPGQPLEFDVPREFWPKGYAEDECNRILPQREQDAITRAAYTAHKDPLNLYGVERIRAEVGYDTSAIAIERQHNR